MKWFLMARHGECSEISVLQRKIPGFSGVETPDSFLDAMRIRGYQAQREPLALPSGRAVQVRVPALSLDLIFVTPELCSTFMEHK